MIHNRDATSWIRSIGTTMMLVTLMLSGCGSPPPDVFTKALADLQEERYDDAIAGFSSAIDQNPQHARAIYYRGVAWDGKNDYPNAVAAYSDAIELEAEIVSARNSGVETRVAEYEKAVPLGAELARAHTRRGFVRVRQAKEYRKENLHDEAYGDCNEKAHAAYNSAIDDFTQALKLNPGSSEAYCGRGTAFLEKDLIEIALGDLTQAVQLSPNYVEALYQLARAQLAMGQIEEAVKHCQHAIRLDSAFANAYGVLGSAYLARGETGMAATCFSEAIRRDPKSSRQLTPRLAEALYQRATALDKEGKHAEAEAGFKQATMLDPGYGTRDQEDAKGRSRGDGNMAKASYLRGRLLLEEGDFDWALVELTAAIRMDREYAEAYLNFRIFQAGQLARYR